MAASVMSMFSRARVCVCVFFTDNIFARGPCEERFRRARVSVPAELDISTAERGTRPELLRGCICARKRDVHLPNQARQTRGRTEARQTNGYVSPAPSPYPRPARDAWWPRCGWSG